MASNLNTKINSYSLERGIEFDQAYTATPTRTGTNPNGSFTSPTLKPSYISTDGPAGGSGSWEIAESPTAGSFTYFRGTSAAATELTGVSDNDFTVGLWFKFTSLPGGTGFASTGNLIMDAQSGGWVVRINGSGYSTSPSRLSIGGSTTAFSYTSPSAIVANQWYYLAIRRVGSGTNNYEIYLNGSLSGTFTSATASAPTSINFGSASASTNAATFRISNYHLAPSSVINATAISEIWSVGSASPNVTITETPATASLLQVDSTLIVTGGNYTEITTSIPVSAEMVNPSSITANYNVTHSETIIDVTATLADTIYISTGIDSSNAAQVLQASALMNNALSSYSPMTASAASGNHSVYVTPNYYSKIKALNPYAYFYDGKTSSTSVNGGYQSVTLAVGSNVYTAYDGGNPLNIIGEGDSWYLRESSNSPHSISITAPSTATSFDNHIGSGNFSLEFWIKPENPMTNLNDLPTRRLFVSEGLTINRYATSFSVSSQQNGISGTIKIDSSGSTLSFSALNVLDPATWHHMVINSSLESNGNISFQIFIDGTSVITRTSTFSAWTPSTNATMIFGGSRFGIDAGNIAIDEIAFYTSALSNSTVIDHFQFINTASPNRTIYPTPLTAGVELLSGSFIITSNVNHAANAITASSQIVNPVVSVSRTINVSATPLQASAANTDVTVKRAWTVYVTPAISYAESTNAIKLSNTYYNYVQANIAPYRYVTFDGANPLSDYGTDADYAVSPTVIGGTIVNPDVAINGKSAKTAGTSYITDGVILKESVHDDDWGVSANHYSSSFWIKRAEDDQSTTGLRIIVNAYGYGTGDYFLLYQYQNKLHFEFKNTTSVIAQTTVGNVDLFDYEKHFVALDLDHSGQTDYAKIYVDATLVMTVNLGTNRISLINGAPHTAPNDEANNYPRYSVGCLITPFAETSLPVQPANTKLYIDEIVWAKSSINQTMVTNLFNVMPVPGYVEISATPIMAEAVLSGPTIITNSNIASTTFTAQVELVSSAVSADREVVTTAQPMLASAEHANAFRVNNIVVISDIFLASSSLGDSNVKITIPGGPMLATATLPKNITPKSPVSLYIKYLVGRTLVTQQSLREVK